MYEQQNWELMGPVYKCEVETLRQELAKVKGSVQSLTPRLKKQFDKMDVFEQTATIKLMEMDR